MRSWSRERAVLFRSFYFFFVSLIWYYSRYLTWVSSFLLGRCFFSWKRKRLRLYSRMCVFKRAVPPWPLLAGRRTNERTYGRPFADVPFRIGWRTWFSFFSFPIFYFLTSSASSSSVFFLGQLLARAHRGFSSRLEMWPYLFLRRDSLIEDEENSSTQLISPSIGLIEESVTSLIRLWAKRKMRREKRKKLSLGYWRQEQDVAIRDREKKKGGDVNGKRKFSYSLPLSCY